MQLQPTNHTPVQLSASKAPPAPAASPAPEEGDKVTWTFRYDARGLNGNVKDLKLKGSINPETGAYDPKWGLTTPMNDEGKDGDKQAGDGVFTARVTLDKSSAEKFQWGVVGTGPKGENQWLIVQDAALELNSSNPKKESVYAPASNHLYGVHRQGEDARFQTWSPAMGRDELKDYKLNVDILGADGKVERSLPMEKDEEAGTWSLQVPGGWKELDGKPYKYAARNSQGEILKTQSGAEVTYADPYARHLQGQQRGLERIFVDPVLGFETGWYDDSAKGGPNYADNPQFGRFTVDGHGGASNVKLVLRDQQDRALTKAELLDRLGEPKFVSYDQASAADKHDVNVLNAWSLANTPKIDSYLWTNSVNDDGSINMKKVESNRTGAGWTTAVNNFPNLVGLKYEFQVYTVKGQLVGDKDGDGKLSAPERQATPFNDPYDNTISQRPGSARASVVKESSFQPRYNDVPRKEAEWGRKVIQEVHVGSFLGPKDNAIPPTAEDLIANIDYLEEMGVTDIYMMPTQEFGGKRDWGYTTDFYFAGSDAYGFEMDRGKAVEEGLIKKDESPDEGSVWIGGTDAIRYLNDQLHKRGFSTMGDVVYNHTSGKPDGDNPLWAVDGDRNSFFKKDNGQVSYSPWGAKLDTEKQGVKDFISNHSIQQVQEMGFDNLREDFVQVLHDTGDVQERTEGMNALRQGNRILQLASPGTKTVAEDFTRNWLVAADFDQQQQQGDILKKGMGYQAVWNDGVRESIYKGIEGTDHEHNMDRLVDSLQNHYGVSSWDHGVLYAHSHDEVGNSGKWVGRAAAHSKEGVFSNYARAAARSGAAVTLTGPGVPMMWQGEEFLANNDFKHGLTSTWGYDTDWLNFKVTPDRLDVFNRLAALPAGERAAATKTDLQPGEEKLFERYAAMSPEEKTDATRYSEQAGHFKSYRDLIALRRSSHAFDATSPVGKVYTHNDDRVAAYTRGQGNDQFLVVTNFSDVNRSGYDPQIPQGQWKEVLNTNGREYGGTGEGNYGATLGGGQRLNLPAGSTIILQKVG